jgi:hypothetical protein
MLQHDASSPFYLAGFEQISYPESVEPANPGWSNSPTFRPWCQVPATLALPNLATFAAAIHRASGIGSRPGCDFPYGPKRPWNLRIPTEISAPPSPGPL